MDDAYTYTLTNGVRIPKIGCGTWQVSNKDVPEMLATALEAGYRLIDTAQIYGNEQGVGKAVRDSGIDRSDIFVVTKIRPDLTTYSEAAAAINESLSTLDVGPIDLVLIHAPRPWDEKDAHDNPRFKENIEVWKALEDALCQKKVRAIGVSNFLQKDVDNLLRECEIAPMVNEVRCSIGDTPESVLSYCKEHKIAAIAYSPIGHGRLLKDREIKQFASKYGVTTAQICIRYALQIGTIPIPKAIRKKYLVENLEVTFDISEDDMEILREMHTK